MKKYSKRSNLLCSTQNKGITLIALVVTIVILIILATISINVVVNNGLITKTQQAEELHKIETLREKLELVKATVAIEHNGKVTVDDYVEELIKENITTPDDVTDNGDETKTVITDDGYSVIIKPDPDNPNNVIIDIEGKSDNLKVKIVKVQLTPGINNIKVDVEVKRAEGAKYKYYYKTGEEEYTLSKETNQTSWTIETLQQETTYTIKVEAINKSGTVYVEEVARTGGITPAVGAITFGDVEWTDGQAKIKVTKTTTDSYKIERKVSDKEGNVYTGKDFTEIASGSYVEGLNFRDIVTVRLTDGTYYGSTATANVTDILEPNEANITLTATSANIGDTVKATVTHSDGQSGINITACKYIINEINGNLGTTESVWDTANTFADNPPDITIPTSSSGTYYLHVLSVDNAGNKIEKTSEAITVEEYIPVTEIKLDKTKIVINLGETAQLTATVFPPNATNKEISWGVTVKDLVLGNPINGLVNPKKPGTAFIVAQSKENINIQAACEVTVLPVIEVGSTVTYNPSGTYNWQAKYCSSTKIETEEDVTLSSAVGEEFNISTWKVIDINNTSGDVTLVPAAPTAGKVYLGGAQGYNNCAKLLNDACNSLYGNEEKGIVARNIDMNTIEAYMTDEALNERYNTSGGYFAFGECPGEVYTHWLPVWYERTDGSEDADYDYNSFIERTEGTNGAYTDGRYIYPSQTLWWQEMNSTTFKTFNDGVTIKGNYFDLLVPKDETLSYWIASRATAVISFENEGTGEQQLSAGFNVRTMSNSMLGGAEFWSDDYEIDSEYAYGGGKNSLFPIVTLKASLIKDNSGNLTVE